MERTLIGSLLELLVVGRLLDQVQDRLGQLGAGQRKGLGVHFFISLWREWADESGQRAVTKEGGKMSGANRREVEKYMGGKVYGWEDRRWTGGW